MRSNRSTLLSSSLAALLVVGLIGCARQPSPRAAHDWIASGWDDYQRGEFDRAIRQFENAAAQRPGNDSTHLQALYGLATTWNLRRPGEDPTRAAQLYRKIIALAPPSDLAAWSLLALARMEHLVPVGQEPHYEEVRKAYQEVIDRFPSHLASQEAFVYQQSTWLVSFREDDAQQALAALEKFVESEPGSVFASTAYALLAQGYTTLRRPEKRLWAEIKAMETAEVDPTNPFLERAATYWKIATIAEFEVGDFDTARRYYRKLIEEYPADIRKYGAKQALKRMDELGVKPRAESIRRVRVVSRETRS